MERILNVTYAISKSLQTENIDIMVAMDLIETIVMKLHLRNEEEFKKYI